jgi:hypothetical protein
MPSQINTWGAAKGSLLGGFGAGILCTGIYFIGQAAGASYVPRDPAALGSEVLAPYMPLVISVSAAVVAFVVLALLARFAREKAWPVFLGISLLVFLLEAVLSILTFGDLATIITLEIMHVPVALGIILGIHRFGIQKLGPSES